jgi:hypothetical protein
MQYLLMSYTIAITIVMPLESPQIIDIRRHRPVDFTVDPQPAKRSTRERPLDVAIVFGEGPVKPIKFAFELTHEELQQWGEFRDNPRSKWETDFRVVGAYRPTPDADVQVNPNNAYIKSLGIEDFDNMSDAERERVQSRREQLQQVGHLSLRRQGRINALAAAQALLNGDTKKIILSGGHSVPNPKIMETEYLRLHPDAEELPEDERKAKVQEYSKTLLTEAELMYDIVAATVGSHIFKRDHSKEQLQAEFEAEYSEDRLDHEFQTRKVSSGELLREFGALSERRIQFTRDHPGESLPDDLDVESYGDFMAKRKREFPGEMYKEFEAQKYDAFIANGMNGRVILEKKAANSLDNVILSLENNPELADPHLDKGDITANHHVERATAICERFGIDIAEGGAISSHEQMIDRAFARRFSSAVPVYTAMMDAQNAPITRLVVDQVRWTEAMNKPEYVKFWIGKIFNTTRPDTALQILRPYLENDDPAWRDAIAEATADVGVDFSQFVAAAEQAAKGGNTEDFMAMREKGFELNDTDKHRRPTMNVLYEKYPDVQAA